MDLELDGKVVVVTGGSDGLGAALAERLVTEGASVAICARGTERLEATAARLTLLGGDVLAMTADVTERAAVDSLFEEVERRWGRCDAVVNNAGTAAAVGFESITDEQWHDDLDLKLLATTRTTRAALPMLRRTGGSVLNVLSIAGKAPTAGSMPSSVSRAAGLAVTKALAGELAVDNVRVNAVLIGLVESGQWRRRAERRGVAVQQVHQELVAAAGVPLGRFGKSEEFADLAAFLVSPRAAYVTGTAVNLDGGLCPVT